MVKDLIITYTWIFKHLDGHNVVDTMIELDHVNFHPAELYGINTGIYMLYKTDTDGKEEFYLFRTKKDTIFNYLKGDISLYDLFTVCREGELYIVKMNDDKFGQIDMAKDLQPEKEPIPDGFKDYNYTKYFTEEWIEEIIKTIKSNQ